MRLITEADLATIIAAIEDAIQFNQLIENGEAIGKIRDNSGLLGRLKGKRL